MPVIGRCRGLGGEAQRRLGNKVCYAAHGGVLVRVGRFAKKWPAERDEVFGGVVIREPEHRERHAKIGHHRRTPVQRRPPHRDPKAAGYGVVLVLTRCEVQRAPQAVGELQGVALIGTLVAEGLTLGLATRDDFTGSRRAP